MPVLFASNDEVVIGIIFGVAAVTIIVPTLIHYIYKAWKTYQEIELKQEMVARGMSVDEIERVLAAGNGPPRPKA
jgi:PDZ domain-containing secreted protein